MASVHGKLKIKPKGSLIPTRHGRPLRIVIVDDELMMVELIEIIIQQQFKDAKILAFQNRDTAWKELLRANPDLLITDLNNQNIPGQPGYMGMSGWKMLSKLAKRAVTYPILVFSGSLSTSSMKARACRCSGPKLNVTFMVKEFTPKLFERQITRLLNTRLTIS